MDTFFKKVVDYSARRADFRQSTLQTYVLQPRWFRIDARSRCTAVRTAADVAAPPLAGPVRHNS